MVNLKISLKESFEKNTFHIFIFPIFFVYCEIWLRVLGKTGIFPNLVYPVLFGIGTGLILSCITSIFTEKTNRILSLILLLLTGLLFTVECLIHRSMQFYLPLGDISTVAGDVAGNYMQQVAQTALFSIPIILVFFLPAILYIIWGKKYMPSRQILYSTSLFLLTEGILILGAAIFAANLGSSSEKFKSQYKFDTATQCFGLVSSMELDVYYAAFGNHAADTFVIASEEVSGENMEAADSEEISEEIQEIVYGKNEMELPLDEISASTSDETLIAMNEYVKSIPASSQNEYTGIFKGKNLILICAEAFSDAAVDEELTPTLYRLTHNGFYFSDFYQPRWGGSTSTGEYSMLMGIAPLKDIRTMPETEDHNLYFTMGNQLQRLGYSGNAYHNGDYKYYSRHLTHQNLGYDEYIALGSGLEDLTRWWPSDSEMIDATLPTYIDNQPFSVYYMTGSGHFPYKSSNDKTTQYIDYVREIVGDKYKDKTLYYLCYQMELEYALASMVEQLEEKGIADDTVICITSDHYPYGLENSSTYGNSEDYIKDLYGYDPQNDWERDRNGWILWSGCLENEYKDLACEISEPTYSLDILPTLSNLFGLEYDSRLLVGRDVFSDTEALVLWTNHSWVTSEGRYNANTKTFYPKENSEADEAYVERIKNVVSNKLSFSGKILNYDYYDILLGDKTPQ